MQIATHIAWSRWAGNSLADAHVQRRLPEAQAAPFLHDLSRLAGRPSMDARFLDDVRQAMPADAARRFDTFERPGALAVVTGQQPGCAGGALLVLLKAATAVCLARGAAESLGRPVVPLFWNGADDVDFDEIARVAWPGSRGELLFLELASEGRRPQAMVGDLPAASDEAVVRAARRLVSPEQWSNLEALLPRGAVDHGTWVSQLLMAVFPDLAVVDARNEALRRHAASLYADYLAVEEKVPGWVKARARELEASGFRPTLGDESLRRGLFLIVDGQRHKVDGDAAALQRSVAQSPESVAPNVLLRALVQDRLFPVIASVVGPAEVGYLHELQPLRQALQVPSSALVPRLSLTWLDGTVWEAVGRRQLPAEEILRSPEEALRHHVRQGLDSRFDGVRTAFEALVEEIRALAPGEVAWGTRSLRRLRRLRDALEREVEAAALQRLLDAEPALVTLRNLIRPRGRPQERLLAGLFLAARWGNETGERLVQIARSHLDELERGRLLHWLVVD